MKYFTAYTLEWISYVVYFSALLLWVLVDRRGIIKVLAGYYFICFLILIRITLARGTSEGNLHLYNILCVFTAFALSAYYFTVLKGMPAKVVILAGCLLNGAYYLFTNVVHDGLRVFDSLAYILLSITVVVLSLWFTVQLLSNVTDDPLLRNLDFWFVASQLIYFTGSFAIFLTFGYLTNKAMNGAGYNGSSTSLTWLWSIHNVLLFLSAVLTLSGVTWISFRKKSQ